MSKLNVVYDGSNNKNFANVYKLFPIDIAAFDYFFQIYKKELEQIDENEEKEIKEGRDEIKSGKFLRFNSAQEYLKYLDDDN